MKPSRVHITGASGSGTTTLARALADHWAVPHADADDYYWLPTVPPFTDKRPAEERVSLMREIFAPREAWVLSGSMLGWGESIVSQCDAVIFLTLDPAERMRRLEDRETRRRVGTTYDPVLAEEFLEWARHYDAPDFTGRSRVTHETWLRQLDQPVLRLDSAFPAGELLGRILAW